MAYVEPKSMIYLIKGCPCDRSYNNTIYFESKLDQWMYFRNLVTHTFTNQYYQRYNRGYLRIQANAEDLYEVNYMVFSNEVTLTPMSAPTNDTKIFYCFVDNIEYINENVTEIHYTIDVMQTYMFDYTLGECFVEREHTVTDNLYGNLIEENVGGDNYVNHLIRTELIPAHGYNRPLYSLMITYVPNKQYISLFNTLVPNGDPESSTGYHTIPDITWQYESSDDPNFTAFLAGCAKNHTYSRPYYIFIDLPPFDNTSSVATMRSLMGHTIHELQKKSCVILNITLVPRQFSHNPDGQTYLVSDWNSASFTYTFNIPQPTQLYTNNGTAFNVKNKKLLSYPYNYLKVSNLDGEERDFMWEHFRKTEDNHVFTVEGVCVSAPECLCIPGYYQGLSNPYTEYSLSISDFPTSVWSEDTMTSYLVQNKNKIGYNAVKNAIRDLISFYSGSIMGEGKWIDTTTTRTSTPQTTTTKTLKSGTVKTTTKGGDYEILKVPHYSEPTATDYAQDAVNYDSNFAMAASITDISNKPDSVRGQSDFSALRNIHNLYGYKFLQVNLREDDARRIDNYFTLFGYAIKDIKTPNIRQYTSNELRPHWNYIKNGFTVVLPFIEEHIKRFVNSDVEEQIQSIYNKGITFWMHGEEVGDYSLDNSPQI